MQTTDRIGVTWAGAALAALVATVGFFGALTVAVELVPVQPSYSAPDLGDFASFAVAR